MIKEESGITDSIVRSEVYRSTEKFLIIAIWVGVFLNLIWCISDYIVLRDHFKIFFIFRFSVSALSAFVLLFRKKLNMKVHHCMFVLVMGISIENAYMWSVMDIPNFQKHAFAYMVLFIGVGMLVLWELKLSIWLVVVTHFVNKVFYVLNSHLTVGEFMINGGLLTFTVAIFSLFMIRTRYRLTYNEIWVRMELEHSNKVIEQKHIEVVEQKLEIQSQKDALFEKNQEITDSINYAKNIQNALIPSEEKFNAHFKDSFVLFKPKDIVSGDFYWVYGNEQSVFYVAADCTGHGVPGGFMTMLGLTFLEEIIAAKNVMDPAEVLNLMKAKIISALNQKGLIGESKDGMDITVCRLDKDKNQLSWSAANNDFYVIRNGSVADKKEFIINKANKQPCGYHHLDNPFTPHTMQLNPGDCVYTFTDGYADQFGGPAGKKFRYKQFEDLLLTNSHLSFKEQKNILNEAIVKWRGNLDQVDDVLVIGIRV